MTTPRDIIIYAGQAFALSLPYAGTAGRGQRAHIRTHDNAADVVQILTHNGAANARVIFNGVDALDIDIGASVSGAWPVGAKRVEWVYDIEDYDLSDVDDVVITHSGKVIVYGNRTREADVTPSDLLPSGDGRYVRFDGVQGLTAEQQERARENIGVVPGTAPGDVVGPASATDSRLAEFDGTTGKLIKQGSYTAAALIAAGAAAAPVQSVSGRTGAIVITVADVSGAESTANKAQPSGYASLDSDGKVPQAQIPAIAITEYLGSVASQAAMLALSGQKGDWCTRSDTGAVWIITGTDPTLLGSWTSITYPASPVTSVAGRTGVVTLSTSDVSGLGTAATHNVPASGNAATGEVVKGNDTRLDVAATAHAATEKTTLADDDEFALIDSAASWVLKRLKWSSIKTALNALYQAILVSGTNIKTINSTSLLGSGDIAIAASPGGSTTQLQYNNAGSFGGLSGTAWDDTNRSLTITGATVTTSKPILDLSQTWNNAGVTFTGLKLNVTNTASAAASLLQDWQVGGTSRVKIANTGATTIRTSGSPTIPLALITDNGVVTSTWLTMGNYTSPNYGAIATSYETYIATGYQLRFYANSIDTSGERMRLMPNGYVMIGGSSSLAWSSNSTIEGYPPDVLVVRDAAGVLAQRNSTNAQTARIYGTYTDVSNYVRAALAATSTAVTLTAETAGTGADDVPLTVTAGGVAHVISGSPLRLPSFTVASLPSAATAAAMIYVSNESGGAVLAFSDGTNWRRVTDRAIVS